MFDPTIIIPRISGCDIDRPMSAIAFEHLSDHTYMVDYLLLTIELPVTRTLFLTPDRSVDPPSVELLKLHYAIARIFHLSAAEEYIDNILRRMDETDGRQLSANGSTPIDHYIWLKLGFGKELSVH
ncbi:hypothetical protein BDV41DRAFT_566721 [Aspergillus transmontanensis]|uniref:HNH nuclease domain-containing protein n=1 Tax=Aspergillus transmontanensis TaxID=1034304 RepID=A0A5N6VNR9_9EURO|nr:hypothetical protein BDV41DRAFT_566721 [Aspergillus transmontanensis]